MLQGRVSGWLTFLAVIALVVAGELADHLARAGVISTNAAFLGAFVLLAILSWPVTRSIPRLVTLRVAYDGEILQFPLDTEAASNNRWGGP